MMDSSAKGGPKANLSSYMRDKREQADEDSRPGPFITISRQYGCSGYFLGLLLVDLLNSEATRANPWRLYSREIIQHLSEETDLAADVINRLRHEKPRAFMDFFRNLVSRQTPGGPEIRNRVAELVRELARSGHAIIIGMGGAGATGDIENGLRVRLEAPVDWRVNKLVESEGLSPVQARLELQKRDEERAQLAEIYEIKFPRQPAFDLVYNCELFSLAQVATHVVQALKLKKML